jgi:hypothetical protein
MENHDVFNMTYILKIIEGLYVISPAMFSIKQAFGRDGGWLREIGIIAELSDCIAFF